MNLDELRQTLASDATKRANDLQKENDALKAMYSAECKEFNEEKTNLLNDCRNLANRCFALTLGSMCCFCELTTYRCPHAMDIDEKIAIAKKLMKETENKDD